MLNFRVFRQHALWLCAQFPRISTDGSIGLWQNFFGSSLFGLLIGGLDSRFAGLYFIYLFSNGVHVSVSVLCFRCPCFIGYTQSTGIVFLFCSLIAIPCYQCVMKSLWSLGCNTYNIHHVSVIGCSAMVTWRKFWLANMPSSIFHWWH